jgi:nitrite reductase/ring-hydroxylating ferredoxin subunit
MDDGNWAMADLPDGMRQVQIDGKPVLVVRRGDRISAIGATCPHAGANLAEGVLDGDRVICPWHKAAFCVETGRLLDPPAVDPVACYQVRRENGRVVVEGPEASSSESDLPPDGRCFVIVGAGAAGAVAAQTLREVGFGGKSSAVRSHRAQQIRALRRARCGEITASDTGLLSGPRH